MIKKHKIYDVPYDPEFVDEYFILRGTNKELTHQQAMSLAYDNLKKRRKQDETAH